MSVEAQARFSQFNEDSANSTYELDDDDIDLDTLEAEDLSRDIPNELIEIEALDIRDSELSGDAAFKKEWGPWSLKVGAAGKLKSGGSGSRLAKTSTMRKMHRSSTAYSSTRNRLDDFCLPNSS